MKINSRPSSLLHLLSPRAWLLVSLVSCALAVGSGAILTSRGDNGLNRFLVRAYDTVELFVRDTIRLTFRSRSVSGVQEAVFVAPKGILDKQMEFNWIDDAQDFESPIAAELPEPIAPIHLLDPTWQPPFAGLVQDKESQ